MGGIGSGGARDGAGRKTIDGERRGRISVSLPAEMLDGLREEGNRRGLPVSQVITELIRRGLER